MLKCQVVGVSKFIVFALAYHGPDLLLLCCSIGTFNLRLDLLKNFCHHNILINKFRMHVFLQKQSLRCFYPILDLFRIREWSSCLHAYQVSIYKQKFISKKFSLQNSGHKKNNSRSHLVTADQVCQTN